jgi:hypothetical protein
MSSDWVHFSLLAFLGSIFWALWRVWICVLTQCSPGHDAAPRKQRFSHHILQNPKTTKGVRSGAGLLKNKRAVLGSNPVSARWRIRWLGADSMFTLAYVSHCIGGKCWLQFGNERMVAKGIVTPTCHCGSCFNLLVAWEPSDSCPVMIVKRCDSPYRVLISTGYM